MAVYTEGMTVRPALPSDLPRLTELAREASREGARTRLGFNPDDFQRFAMAMMGTPISEVFVAEKNGRVYGMVGAFITPMYFNSQCIVIQEAFMWTDYCGAGDPLVRALEKWAHQHGAAEVMLILSTETERAHRASKYLTKRGYDHVESLYARLL